MKKKQSEHIFNNKLNKLSQGKHQFWMEQNDWYSFLKRFGIEGHEKSGPRKYSFK